MKQSNFPPVLAPVQVDSPLEACTYLTTLLHQTLACTIELRALVAQVAGDLEGKDIFQWPRISTAMTGAIDAYIDLVAARLIMLDRVGQSPAWTAFSQGKGPRPQPGLLPS